MWGEDECRGKKKATLWLVCGGQEGHVEIGGVIRNYGSRRMLFAVVYFCNNGEYRIIHNIYDRRNGITVTVASACSNEVITKNVCTTLIIFYLLSRTTD